MKALPRLHILSPEIPTILSVLNAGQTSGLSAAIISKRGSYSIRVGQLIGTACSMDAAYSDLQQKMAEFAGKK